MKDVAAAILNYNDEAYLKCGLDDKSQKFFTENLSLIQEPLQRSLVYLSIWNRVRDGKVSF